MSGISKMLQAGIENESQNIAEAKSNTKTAKPKKEPINKIAKKKNKGGRPSNKEKGLTSRKQYSLTLKEADYKAFLDKAREEDLSFAKVMEKAAKEYINRTID